MQTAAGAAAPQEAGEREGGRPGLELPGRVSRIRREAPPRAYLPSGRTRTGRCGEKAAYRGGRPRGPVPSLPPAPGAPGRSDDRTAGPGTRYLRRREFPGARTPRPPSLFSQPAPPLRSRRGRPRAGRGLRLPARARSPELASCCLLRAPSGAGSLRGVRERLGSLAVSSLPAQHGGGGRAGS